MRDPTSFFLDGQTNKIFLDVPNWPEYQLNNRHEEEDSTVVHFPEQMLSSKSVARMIIFSSKEVIE